MKRILVMLSAAFGLACVLSVAAQADPGGKDKRGKNREKLQKKLKHEREKAQKKTEKSREQARRHFRKGNRQGTPRHRRHFRRGDREGDSQNRPRLQRLRNPPRFKQSLKKLQDGRKHRTHSREKCRRDVGKFHKKQSKEREKNRRKASKGRRK